MTVGELRKLLEPYPAALTVFFVTLDFEYGLGAVRYGQHPGYMEIVSDEPRNEGER